MTNHGNKRKAYIENTLELCWRAHKWNCRCVFHVICEKSTAACEYVVCISLVYSLHGRFSWNSSQSSSMTTKQRLKQRDRHREREDGIQEEHKWHTMKTVFYFSYNEKIPFYVHHINLKQSLIAAIQRCFVLCACFVSIQCCRYAFLLCEHAFQSPSFKLCRAHFYFVFFFFQKVKEICLWWKWHTKYNENTGKSVVYNRDEKANKRTIEETQKMPKDKRRRIQMAYPFDSEMNKVTNDTIQCGKTT